MCSAIAASATAIGSCACTTSGWTIAEDLAELPGGMDVELAARREADEAQALLRAPLELAAVMGDEHRRLTDRLQTSDELQDLVLSAAPGLCGIDVDGAHRRRRPRGSFYGFRKTTPEVVFSHSFANFRNT